MDRIDRPDRIEVGREASVVAEPCTKEERPGAPTELPDAGVDGRLSPAFGACCGWPADVPEVFGEVTGALEVGIPRRGEAVVGAGVGETAGRETGVVCVEAVC